jgi:RTX calcium-binding nonapeptide repeat (4 copies)
MQFGPKDSDLPALIRPAALACLACTVALAGPGSADAAKLDADSDEGYILYEAEAGDTTTLVIDQSGDTFTFTDAGAARINANNLCTSMLMIGTCTAPGITSVRVHASAGSDVVSAATTAPLDLKGNGGHDVLASGAAADRVDGGAGNDTIAGGAGVDTILGGDGDDVISSRDGIAEEIDCGPGQDTVDADSSDIALGCEVGAPSQPAPGGEILGPPPLEPPDPPGADDGGSPAEGPDATDAGGSDRRAPNRDVLLAPMPLDMLSADVAVVHMACAATAADHCMGEVVLELAGRRAQRRVTSAARGRDKARQRRIGRSRFLIEPGKSLDVRVRINERGHAIMRSKRRQRGRIKIVHRNAAGDITGVTTRSVVFTARKWGRRKARRRR